MDVVSEYLWVFCVCMLFSYNNLYGLISSLNFDTVSSS